MSELIVFLSACALTQGFVFIVDRFGGEQYYSE